MSELRVFDYDYFKRPTLEVAPELLGSILCRRFSDGEILRASIVELEAYTNDDPACHAFAGKTRRCEVMFGPPARSYVYFIYGMYNCLNVVTEPEGVAAAVLIRAIAMPGAEGPGKLCRLLQIDRTHNNLDLLDPEGELWLEAGEALPKKCIGSSPRIGVSAAQDRLWRFYVKDSPYLSGQKGKRTSKQE